MGNKKDNKNKQFKAVPKTNNDQLGENASEMHVEDYSNKGPKAKEKRR